MVSSDKPNPVYDIRISTVAPGFISGHDAAQELSTMDLAMKLHYLRFVFYFPSPAFDGFTILNIKESMFNWLSHAYIPCGRFRRSDSGRPYIKCNDSGVRIIEAKCHLGLDEWLESRDDSRNTLLVPNNVIDAFSAMGFIKLWAQAIVGHYPAQPLTMAQPQVHARNCQSLNPSPDPLSVKRVDPVGDLWSTSNTSKLETFSLCISTSELIRLQAKICREKGERKISPFECICVVIWQCVAKARQGLGPEAVTICRSDMRNRAKGIITNKSQTISLVKTDLSVAKSDPMELGLLIMNQAVDERMKIEETIERDDELPDFLIYGANLTFVDLSDVPFYEMEVRGQKPAYVNYAIDNIGDEGVVLVLPTPKNCPDGKMVSVTLPENQVVELKSTLKEDWCIA
ncbi:Chloramphenicol acetyltransferase-like domain-containing protein [Cynara cardunculus var. scolymus]|uniref:Chloramphenicol acetyltransferase-like domain-containing protein n=1 Tax=Cynara cardunculus var. scolymus TaxID=59895 RepID=A0A118JZY5_CYNCS|nr:Chloramphenicol acetyltransferase-like domain-containing protein [Cynara cardunculus var. scolymus]